MANKSEQQKTDLEQVQEQHEQVKQKVENFKSEYEKVNKQNEILDIGVEELQNNLNNATEQLNQIEKQPTPEQQLLNTISEQHQQIKKRMKELKTELNKLKDLETSEPDAEKIDDIYAKKLNVEEEEESGKLAQRLANLITRFQDLHQDKQKQIETSFYVTKPDKELGKMYTQALDEKNNDMLESTQTYMREFENYINDAESEKKEKPESSKERNKEVNPTLAEIYSAHENYKKAMKVYEELITITEDEKQKFEFENKITELKKKLRESEKIDESTFENQVEAKKKIFLKDIKEKKEGSQKAITERVEENNEAEIQKKIEEYRNQQEADLVALWEIVLVYKQTGEYDYEKEETEQSKDKIGEKSEEELNFEKELAEYKKEIPEISQRIKMVEDYLPKLQEFVDNTIQTVGDIKSQLSAQSHASIDSCIKIIKRSTEDTNTVDNTRAKIAIHEPELKENIVSLTSTEIQAINDSNYQTIKTYKENQEKAIKALFGPIKTFGKIVETMNHLYGMIASQNTEEEKKAIWNAISMINEELQEKFNIQLLDTQSLIGQEFDATNQTYKVVDTIETNDPDKHEQIANIKGIGYQFDEKLNNNLYSDKNILDGKRCIRGAEVVVYKYVEEKDPEHEIPLEDIKDEEEPKKLTEFVGENITFKLDSADVAAEIVQVDESKNQVAVKYDNEKIWIQVEIDEDTLKPGEVAKREDLDKEPPKPAKPETEPKEKTRQELFDEINQQLKKLPADLKGKDFEKMTDDEQNQVKMFYGDIFNSLEDDNIFKIRARWLFEKWKRIDEEKDDTYDIQRKELQQGEAGREIHTSYLLLDNKEQIVIGDYCTFGTEDKQIYVYDSRDEQGDFCFCKI